MGAGASASSQLLLRCRTKLKSYSLHLHLPPGVLGYKHSIPFWTKGVKIEKITLFLFLPLSATAPPPQLPPCPITPDFLSELQEQHPSLCFLPGSPPLTPTWCVILCIVLSHLSSPCIFTRFTARCFFPIFKNHSGCFCFFWWVQ
ncbi:hypothetical protein HJG60_007793 [Phyllostomus discolor]|uniref:Uncharacterized protein n=1 Tax=Phyllostomus discolor TaxID=89673 RepID=A0A834BH93_9CHIR|nr:hypothetical protein HJG60_007793 [Phyllostomus discolor]